MKEYNAMLATVMSDNVSLADWQKFMAYRESLPRHVFFEKLLAGQKPTEEEKQDYAKRSDDFVRAAHHVAGKLSLEDICCDAALLLAYEELRNPEKFS